MLIMHEMKRKRTHPGENVRDAIEGLGISQAEFASRLGVSRRTVCELVACKRNISPEMALRLGKFLGMSPESWMNMQVAFDLQSAEQAHSESLSKIVPRAIAGI